MSSVLKGNFEVKNTVASGARDEERLEDKFEREALNRLGGSIAFVSKKLVKWDVEN